MTPTRCALCGDLAENPSQLEWVIPDSAGEPDLHLSLSLCVACSQSWCHQSARPRSRQASTPARTPAARRRR